MTTQNNRINTIVSRVFWKLKVIKSVMTVLASAKIASVDLADAILADDDRLIDFAKSICKNIFDKSCLILLLFAKPGAKTLKVSMQR